MFSAGDPGYDIHQRLRGPHLEGLMNYSREDLSDVSGPGDLGRSWRVCIPKEFPSDDARTASLGSTLRASAAHGELTPRRWRWG